MSEQGKHLFPFTRELYTRRQNTNIKNHILNIIAGKLNKVENKTMPNRKQTQALGNLPGAGQPLWASSPQHKNNILEKPLFT